MLSFIKNNSFTIIYTLLVGVMPLLVSSSISYWVVVHEPDIQLFTFQNWAVVYLCACFTMAFALTPTTFVALLSGYFLGWISFFPLAISYWIASFIGFSIANKIDDGRLSTYIQQKPEVQALLQNLQTNELKIIFLARLSPVLPFALTNVLFSVMHTRLRNFLSAGFLGMVPRTLLSIWIGTQAQEIRKLIEHPHQDNLAQWLIIGLILVSVVGLFWVIKRASRSL